MELLQSQQPIETNEREEDDNDAFSQRINCRYEVFVDHILNGCGMNLYPVHRIIPFTTFFLIQGHIMIIAIFRHHRTNDDYFVLK